MSNTLPDSRITWATQWSKNGVDITSDPCAESNADSVRLWVGYDGEADTCIAEWTRGDDGVWTVTGSDYGHRGAFESATLNGFTNPTAAVTAGKAWFHTLSRP